MCRTSKRFLPTAQQLLYHSPLSDSDLISWRRSLQLLESLSFDNKRLGRLVRSFEGFVEFEAELRKMALPPNRGSRFQRSDLDGVSIWKSEMIEACPMLEAIDLNLTDGNELREIEAALTQSASTICRIRFGGRGRPRVGVLVVPALV